MSDSAHPPPRSLAASLIEIHRDEYLSIFIEPAGKLVRLVRSRQAHPSAEAMKQSFQAAAAAIDRSGRTGRVLLLDMREAIGRNDPEFTEMMSRMRPLIETGFSRIGVLVRTQVGMLQIKRLAQEDGVSRFTSTSEEALLDYLRTGTVPGDPSGRRGPTSGAF